MDSNFYDKRKLIEYLSVIRDAEVNKPPQEADEDVIEACVELLLIIQDKNGDLTPEQINKAVKAIPFEDTVKITELQNKNKKINKIKLLLIAAIIPIILTILTLMAMADTDWSYSKILKELFGGVDNTPVGEVVLDNGIEIEKDSRKLYKTPQEFAKDYDINILIPNDEYKTNKLKSISYINYSTGDEIEFCFEDNTLTYSIWLDKPLPNELSKSPNRHILINAFDCYIIELSDIGIYQIYFSHNGHTYCLSYSDLDVIIDLIENMEEIQ